MAQDPVSVARLVAAVFEHLSLRYAIGGAVASTILGEPRATNDVDIVAAIAVGDVPSLIDALEAAGFYVPHDAAREAVRTKRSFNIVHRESVVKVDIFVAGRTALDEDELARRRPVSIGDAPLDLLFVVAPEDLIAQKLRWYRDGGEVLDRQWRDVLGLIKVQGARLDHALLAHGADRLAVADLLRRAVLESVPIFEDDLALAHRLADAAAEVTLSFWRRDPQRWSKADGSLATEADLATEDRLRAILGEVRPADAILGEERGASGSASRRWVLDGIDGTVEFAAGTEEWGTLIALEVDGEVVLGLCVEPSRRRRTWAVLGGGAFRRDDGAEPRRLSVSGGTSLAQARTYLPPAHYVPDAAAEQMANAVRARTATVAGFPYHPALEVAEGRAEVAVLFTGGVWDIAAPALIVTEAGGRFTAVTGDSRLDAGSAVYSNGILHDDTLRVLAPLAGATSRG